MQRQQLLEGWVQRNGRRDVDLAALVYCADGSQATVRVSNLSYEGCEVASEHPFAIGERITIALPNLGEIVAQVRWSLPRECRAGTQFLLEESVAD